EGVVRRLSAPPIEHEQPRGVALGQRLLGDQLRREVVVELGDVHSSFSGGYGLKRKHPPARIRAPPQVARSGVNPSLAAKTASFGPGRAWRREPRAGNARRRGGWRPGRGTCGR